MKLILASASPRRAEILANAGIAFDAIATETDETRRPGETVEAMVVRLAEAKARSAERLREFREPAIIVGADTVVEIDGLALGKPRTAAVARQMLRRLSGREHRVLTGLAVLRLPEMEIRLGVEGTTVRFASLKDEEVEAYAYSDEPLDKAGGYAIQGIAGRYIERIEGCYFNVVGLPLARLYRMLREMGWDPDFGQGATQRTKKTDEER